MQIDALRDGFLKTLLYLFIRKEIWYATIVHKVFLLILAIHFIGGIEWILTRPEGAALLSSDPLNGSTNTPIDKFLVGTCLYVFLVVVLTFLSLLQAWPGIIRRQQNALMQRSQEAFVERAKKYLVTNSSPAGDIFGKFDFLSVLICQEKNPEDKAD
jgi:hypothetical protein